MAQIGSQRPILIDENPVLSVHFVLIPCSEKPFFQAVLNSSFDVFAQVTQSYSDFLEERLINSASWGSAFVAA